MLLIEYDCCLILQACYPTLQQKKYLAASPPEREALCGHGFAQTVFFLNFKIASYQFLLRIVLVYVANFTMLLVAIIV